MECHKITKTTIVAFLDKTWPPEHSFVNGMLATEAARRCDIKMRLVVSSDSDRNTRIRRYWHAACLPILRPRRGAGRLINILLVVRAIARFSRREHCRKRRVVVFVRNDPALLFGASIRKYKIDRLVFQTSFPHEEFGHAVKRFLAKMLYRIASSRVDAVTAVSPVGLQRAKRLFPHTDFATTIPLLCDFPVHKRRFPASVDLGRNNNTVNFVYIGTHDPHRGLDFVLQGIVKSVKLGAKATFLFVGGSATDIGRLSNILGVQDLQDKRIVSFAKPVPRSEIPVILSTAHVGLSLIPPTEIYRELSPTKLAEYMGAGLAVLGTHGIPLQEDFIRQSGGGLLTEWNADAISKAILALTLDHEGLKTMMSNANEYAAQNLQYSSYVECFVQLIEGPGNEIAQQEYPPSAHANNHDKHIC